MIESCFGNHLNVQHATDYMGTYLMYLWAINVIVIIDFLRGKLEGPYKMNRNHPLGARFS